MHNALILMDTRVRVGAPLIPEFGTCSVIVFPLSFFCADLGRSQEVRDPYIAKPVTTQLLFWAWHRFLKQNTVGRRRLRGA